MVNKDSVRLLTLSIDASNSLIVKLKIPRNAKPDDMMARPLEVKSMAHACRMSEQTGDVPGIESVNNRIQGLWTNSTPENWQITKTRKYPFPIMIVFV